MDKEQWQLVREIFTHISDESPSFRDNYLAMVCEQNTDIRHEVERMLLAHDRIPENLDPASPQSWVNKTLGDYHLDALLASGEICLVFKATHPTRGTVCVKLLPDRFRYAIKARARFQREADGLKRLRHPLLCRFFEVVETQDALAIAMEYIEGETLEGLISRELLDVRRILGIAIDLATALNVIHGHGVIHRDLKPANIMVTPQDTLKIIDFGIARSPQTRLTEAGALLGSPRYMSPEQWRGDPVDGRTDYWSLGVLLYRLLSGRVPFDQNDLADLSIAILQDSAPAISTDGTPFDDLVNQLMHKDAEQRPANANEIMKQLQDIDRLLRQGRHPGDLAPIDSGHSS